MVSNWTLDLISSKLLLKTCCLKCLIRYDTKRWWAKLSNSRRFLPYLNTDPVVRQLTHYRGLYDLNRKWSCFCYFTNLFKVGHWRSIIDFRDSILNDSPMKHLLFSYPAFVTEYDLDCWVLLEEKFAETSIFYSLLISGDSVPYTNG